MDLAMVWEEEDKEEHLEDAREAWEDKVLGEMAQEEGGSLKKREDRQGR